MVQESDRGNFSCGVDEAGRGPVIGPLVVSIVCGYDDEMREIGARDSKALGKNSRKRLYELIKENSAFYLTREISPVELNEMMSRINLNEIEEDAYSELIAAAPFDCVVYVDSFDVNSDRLSGKLSRRTGKNVVCEHKADARYPTVSAASIISKVTRDADIEKLEQQYGKIGSGYPSDPVTIGFLKRSLDAGTDITRIVRTHWKTYRNLVGNSRNRKLF